MTKQELLEWINEELDCSSAHKTKWKNQSEWMKGQDSGWINALQEIKSIYWD